ncbi:hypothetical protein ACR56S_11815 [Staphylococcus hominis]|uniref:hypothetical protein n=1 Tax=Staphylococcus hominis TaxID=1290 RepID=UPI003DA112D8
MKKRKTDLEVQITGVDSNIFSLCGTVTKALRRNGYREYANELPEKISQASSYHDAIDILDTYVAVY